MRTLIILAVAILLPPLGLAWMVLLMVGFVVGLARGLTPEV